MSLTRSTPPATEPVTSAQVKEYLRVDSGDTSQDVIIPIIIEAARLTVEEFLRRTLITTEWTYEINSSEMVNGLILLPRPPVASITTFLTYYYDSNDTLQTRTVTAANYDLVANRVIFRNDGWQVEQTLQAAQIIYSAGYGASATDVPADIRLTILDVCALMYEERGQFNLDNPDPKYKMNIRAALDKIETYRYGGV